MNRLFIYDTETTGIDPEKHSVIEAAFAIYDIDRNAVVETGSKLMRASQNDAEAINGIPQALVAEAAAAATVWPWVGVKMKTCDAIVAHRADFDRSFTPEGIVPSAIPWVCSKFDIKWPNSPLGEHLINIALQHGLAVMSAHRAMSDVDTLVRVFRHVSNLSYAMVSDAQDAGPAYIRELIRLALRPKVRVVSLAGFDDKDTVKAHGFAWHPDLKVWDRWMPADDVSPLPFRTKIDERAGVRSQPTKTQTSLKV